MAGDEAEPEPKPEAPAPSRRLPRPRADTEKAIGLEVARLFGISPRLLVTPRRPPSEDEEPTENA